MTFVLKILSSPPRACLFTAVVVCLCMSGCGTDEYPADLRFPERTDPLILELPQAQPTGFDSPGQFQQRLGDLLALEATGKGGKFVDPLDGEKGLKPADRQQLTDALEKMFGTPSTPWLRPLDPNNTETVEAVEQLKKDLKLDDAILAQGTRLYRRHCLHCHGLSGDGRGATAPWVNPHPRDFRQGQFKFTSSRQEDKARKPRRADLIRILKAGVEGTSMPAFDLLSEQELDALVSTVIHLSLRGHAEFGTIAAWTGAESRETETITDELQLRTAFYGSWWQDANQELISVEEDQYPYKEATAEQMAQSIAEGHKLFKAAGCLDCHLDYGRKDTFRYDVWGTVVRPNNLTRGVYRGGRRPIDLYWRIHSGIGPSTMPAAPENVKSEKKIWDLVNFVQALPYPERLPEAVRAEVYPAPRKD